MVLEKNVLGKGNRKQMLRVLDSQVRGWRQVGRGGGPGGGVRPGTSPGPEAC